MPKNTVFFLIGFMGSGKSYLGNKLSKKLNYTFVDLDTYIETESMMFISDIFARFGEPEFRRIEAECLRKVSENQDNIIISCGGGTPFYNSNWEWMQEKGLTAPTEPGIASAIGESAGTIIPIVGFGKYAKIAK